eukprot:1263068-Pyramimonas_sp.AAC.1
MTPVTTEEGSRKSSDISRTMDEITEKSSEIEMRAMFAITDSGTESDTSNLLKEMVAERSSGEPVNIEQDMLGYNLILPHLPPAAVANFQDRREQWTQRGQSRKRWHFVPRLVT